VDCNVFTLVSISLAEACASILGMASVFFTFTLARFVSVCLSFGFPFDMSIVVDLVLLVACNVTMLVVLKFLSSNGVNRA